MDKEINLLSQFINRYSETGDMFKKDMVLGNMILRGVLYPSIQQEVNSYNKTVTITLNFNFDAYDMSNCSEIDLEYLRTNLT